LINPAAANSLRTLLTQLTEMARLMMRRDT
jgi:hypothetical protein